MMKTVVARGGSRLRCVGNGDRLDPSRFFPFFVVGAEVDEFYVPVVHTTAILVLAIDRFFLDDVTIIVIIILFGITF